ncbi:MAG: thiaminase II [marine benthic group bacterium]|jgi:thiaminase/transcriptional activator TenA|nr:thiaminase II [Gemmatimonadota bacterium]MCL7977572.1 thiaminase II [Gemmatimonadota bacterium]
MAAGSPVAGSLTAEMREAAAPIWNAQLEHPFVRGLADGSLEPEIFERWVRQDYLYLVEFARVFAWAAARSDRLESMGWYAQVLDLTLNTEMALHREYAARFGISESELETEEMWPTTRAYTDFLVRTAADGDLADLLAVLLPCAWGYAWLGERLAEGEDPTEPRYADWIDQYASAEFQDVAAWLREEMERVAGGADVAKRERLIDLFVLSSRYEHRFWEMCWTGETW